MKNAIAALALAVTVLPFTAQAKNICLIDNYGQFYLFKNIKALKPGAVVSLNGVTYTGYILTGTAAFTSGTGKVNYAVTISDTLNGTQRFMTVNQGDTALQGTGVVDENFDGAAESYVNLVTLDCKSMPPI